MTGQMVQFSDKRPDTAMMDMIRDFDRTLEELARMAEKEGLIHIAERIRWRKDDYFLDMDEDAYAAYKRDLEVNRYLLDLKDR